MVNSLTLLLAVVMVAMRSGFPPSIRGIGHWAFGIPLFVASTVFFGLQDSHPFFRVMLANTLILLGVLGMTWGMLRFLARPVPNPRYVAIGGLLLVGVMAWYTFIQPSFNSRLIIMSLTLAALFGYVSLLPLRYSERRLGAMVSSLAFLLTTCSCLLRLGTVTAGFDRPSGLLDFGTVQVIYLSAFNLSVLIGSLGFLLMANERLRSILEYHGSHDALTGTLNRGAFFRTASREFALSRAGGKPLAVLLLDLDHFKLINDRHGHAMGDRVLQNLCNVLRTVLRPVDVLGRYGGEEFVILLRGMAREDALAMAHRLRAAIQPTPDLPEYSVSMGFTTLTPTIDSIDELLNGADKALYRAKRNGRNRIEEWVWSGELGNEPFQGAARQLDRAAATH